MTHVNRQETSSKPVVLANTHFRLSVLALVACLAMVGLMFPALAQETTDATAATLRLLRFEASGPVRLEVHDPHGRRVGRDLNEIDGATFEETDDGMVIEIAEPTPGDYELHVDSDGSANRIHLFDVWATDGVSTIPLAERVMIMNVPSDPYVIRVSEDGISDVTGTAGSGSGSDAGDGGSSVMIWVIVIVVVVAGGAAAYFILRARKRKP